MFEDAFGLKDEANAIRSVVNKSLEQGIVTEDLASKDSKAYKTSEVGDWLVANLKKGIALQWPLPYPTKKGVNFH
jgi:3-isopropylmalate dehydrogenase